jgi:hypothetical protein
MSIFCFESDMELAIKYLCNKGYKLVCMIPMYTPMYTVLFETESPLAGEHV